MDRWIALCITLFAAAFAQAQAPAKTYRIGWLTAASPSSANENAQDLKQALMQRGYSEQQLIVDVRAASGDTTQLSALATALAATRPDVIVATATPGTLAAKAATSTVPIVFIGVSDPLGQGFVQTLARPGGNVTRIANMGNEYMPKMLEVLGEIVPRAKRIALLATRNPGATPIIGNVEAAARQRNQTVQVARVTSLAEITDAIASFKKQRVEGLVVLSDGAMLQYREQLAQLLNQARLPAIYAYAANVEAGGLASYGPATSRTFDQIADYVDRVLKGAKPAEMAVVGPAEFELVVNRGAARAIGLKLPDALLVRANRVID